MLPDVIFNHRRSLVSNRSNRANCLVVKATLIPSYVLSHLHVRRVVFSAQERGGIQPWQGRVSYLQFLSFH